MAHQIPRSLLSALAHGSIFFSGFIVPIAVPAAILVVSEDSVVRDNCREALNFHLTVWLALVVSALMCVFVIGIPMLFAVAIVSWLMPIVAIIKVLAEPTVAFSYPYVLRLV